MDTKNLHFETLQLHAGQEQPDPATDARAVKTHPELFEKLRGDYPLRREKEAYTIVNHPE